MGTERSQNALKVWVAPGTPHRGPNGIHGAPCEDLCRDHVAKLPQALNLTPNPQRKSKGKQDAAVPTTDRRPKGFHGTVAWSCLRIGCALGAVVVSDIRV